MTTATTTASLLDPPRNLIDGSWCSPDVIPGQLNVDPNSDAPVHASVTSGAADVEAAIAAADRLHREAVWQDLSSERRTLVLNTIADLLEGRVGEIARIDSLTSGVPITTTRMIAGFLPGRFREAAVSSAATPTSRALPAGGRDVRLLSLPWGPAAVLTPWNAPSFIAASKVASALAAGCPVIFKPSEWAAATAQPLAESIAESLAQADAPLAAFQVLHGAGDVGARLTSDPRVKVIAFTGGQTAGQSIARAAADHFTKLHLELGGNNPVLVLRDADVPAAATSLARGMTLLNGQWCEGPGKILVRQELADQLVEALTGELASLLVGHSLDEHTQLGPLVHRRHRDGLRAQLSAYEQQGGTLIEPLLVPDEGAFLSPTLVLGIDPDDATQELFGPVVTVHPVDGGDADVLAAANAHPSGLDAYVYGQDLDHAMRIAARVASGEVRVNGAHLADLADGSAQAFWGIAGIGGHGPSEPVRVFRGERVVGVDSPDLVI